MFWTPGYKFCPRVNLNTVDLYHLAKSKCRAVFIQVALNMLNDVLKITKVLLYIAVWWCYRPSYYWRLWRDVGLLQTWRYCWLSVYFKRSLTQICLRHRMQFRCLVCPFCLAMSHHRQFCRQDCVINRGSNAPWFTCWFRRYINNVCLCLCLYITSFLSPFLPSLLSSFLRFFIYLLTRLLPDLSIYFFQNKPVSFRGRMS